MDQPSTFAYLSGDPRSQIRERCFRSTALAPFIEHRRKQAGDLLKVLDYKKGEQVRVPLPTQ